MILIISQSYKNACGTLVKFLGLSFAILGCQTLIQRTLHGLLIGKLPASLFAIHHVLDNSSIFKAFVLFIK